MDEIRSLIKYATAEERQALADILKSSEPTIDGILEAFWWNCQSVFGWALLENRPSYSQIVCQIAKKLKIVYDPKSDIQMVEIQIAQEVLKTAWEKLTPEQKAEMEIKLRKAAQEFDKNGATLEAATAFGALTAAQLSGFGVYMLASTALGTLTGALGIALPFAVYTSMSSAIAIIIGPVGWFGLGLFITWRLTGPNYKTLIPAVLYVLGLREKQRCGFA